MGAALQADGENEVLGDDLKHQKEKRSVAAELTAHDKPIRRRLGPDLQRASGLRSTACLKAAVKAGELPQDFKCEEVGDFVLSSLQGAILLSKGRRDTSPITNFKRVLFASVLR